MSVLSDPDATMIGVDVLWPEGWRVELTGDLPRGYRGLTLFPMRLALIRDDLHPWERRATEVHESIHAHDGPVLPHQTEREERRVERETARRLIRLDDLLDAMRATNDAAVAAEWLEVPQSMVWARLQGLHPSERAKVKRELAQ